MSPRTAWITATVFGVLLAGCVGLPPSGTSSGRFGADGPGGSTVSRSALPGAADQAGGPLGLSRGNDTFIDRDALAGRGRERVEVNTAGGGLVELSLLNASIAAAAQAVLGDTLRLNYVLSENVSGRVTLQTTAPVSGEVLYDLFQAALAANGAQMRQEGGVVRIVPGTSGIRDFRLAADGVAGGGSIIVAPLEFVSPREIAELMEPLTEDGLRLLPDTERNLLLMSGPPAALEAGLDALNLFDVDVLAGKSVALVRLRAAEPDAIVDELQRIFASEEGGSLEGVIEFVPNARLGSVLVISSRARYMDRARRWIRELDRTAAGSRRYLQTYDLSNRNADEVAPILDALLADVSSSGTGVVDDGEESAASASGDRAIAKVAADTSRNALVVRATRDEHAEIAHLLRDLDTAARQVMLEATIAEVTLNDELDAGVRWYLQSGDLATTFSDFASGAVTGRFPGFSAVLRGTDAGIALSALASVTDVKVISSPTLVVVDNQEGILQIGDEVPIATQTASQALDDSIVLTQVEYRDTGIILRVRPRIGAHGRVNLQIEQEVSDVSSTRTSGIDSPTISTRRIQTNAILSDGQTLTLGGLVQEQDNESRGEVPGLGRIPGVGGLFRSKTSRRGRTELLILIRPRVIFDDRQAGAITAGWREKLSDTNSILATGLGSPRHTARDLVP